MRTVDRFPAVRETYAGTVGLVPTMGALHEGHTALTRQARAECDTVVVSVFVNPLQFGPGEDLDRYPRTFDRDLRLAEEAGADLVFAPDVEEIYPDGSVTRVQVPGLSAELEGRARPGHFDGVATVVTKLLAGLQPDRAYFGRKDGQQLAVIRRLVADLAFPVEVVPVSTVREPDGLALSSRNRFLDAGTRAAATALSRGLFLAADAVEAGERDGAVLRRLVEGQLAAVDVAADYVALVDAATATSTDVLKGESFLAVAARLGATRLIDNVAFLPQGGEFIADRGRLLGADSTLEAS